LCSIPVCQVSLGRNLSLSNRAHLSLPLPGLMAPIMRCVLSSAFAAMTIVAVRVDEDPDLATINENTADSVEFPEEAIHGSHEILLDKKAASHQAIVAARKHITTSTKLADEVRSHALKRGARHAVQLDKEYHKQNRAGDAAQKKALHHDHLVKRAAAIAAHKHRVDKHHAATKKEEAYRTEMEDVHMECAVAAARKEQDQEKVWKESDKVAGEAHKAMEAAVEKETVDKDSAEKAADESELRDKDVPSLAAAAKALAARAEAKKAKKEEAAAKKDEAWNAKTVAHRNEMAALEQADSSEAAAKKATKDRAEADQEVEEAVAAQKAAAHKCSVESYVAHQTLEEADVATEVHLEKVDSANEAAVEASKAKVKAAWDGALERSTHAALYLQRLTSSMPK